MTEEPIVPPDLPPKEPTEPVTPPPKAGIKIESVEVIEPPKPNTLIDDANLAAKRMEDATAALKIENERAEALKVETTLGGEAEAGTPQTKEDTPEEYAKKVMENDIERV